MNTVAGLDAVTDADNWCYRSSWFPIDGGWLGFLGSGITGKAYVDNVTVRSYDGEDWNVEIEENFEIDASGYSSDRLVHDDAGNLTYDGLYSYTYDLGIARLHAQGRGFRRGPEGLAPHRRREQPSRQGP